MNMPAPLALLLDRADHERSAGRGAAAAQLYDEAIRSARDAGDLGPWIRAALGAAALHVFGTEPGRLPAELYDLLVRITDDRDRSRVAAALAHIWTYGGESSRAAPFAAEALERAERTAEPELIADALDAMLACHWGPDDLEIRIDLERRLDEVAAHVLDPDTRLQAHLWGLQIACETLNIQGVHRHLRALDRLGAESSRARFFAVSRQLMYDLLRGRTDTAADLIDIATACSEETGLADAWMVLSEMTVYSAVVAGDTGTCARIAAQAESFALAEGTPEICAEAAWMWIGAGRPDRAGRLLDTLGGTVLEQLPRDVNWLLTVQCTLQAALAADRTDLIGRAAGLLGPYENRAVFNAGAVAFHGLTDDTLSRAAALAGDHERAGRLRERALACYVRLGAAWWYDRLRDWQPPTRAGVAHLHPIQDGLWLIGPGSGTPVRAVRGYHYLRLLLARPGTALPAVDVASDGGPTVLQPSVGDLIDAQALAAYRSRLAAIDSELDEADDWADLARAEELRTERSALLDELSAATGIGGRRRTTTSTNERARVAVTKAIGVAVDRISRLDADLGRHLRATVHTGGECCYRPDGAAPTWILDSRPSSTDAGPPDEISTTVSPS